MDNAVVEEIARNIYYDFIEQYSSKYDCVKYEIYESENYYFIDLNFTFDGPDGGEVADFKFISQSNSLIPTISNYLEEKDISFGDLFLQNISAKGLIWYSISVVVSKHKIDNLHNLMKLKNGQAKTIREDKQKSIVIKVEEIYGEKFTNNRVIGKVIQNGVSFIR